MQNSQSLSPRDYDGFRRFLLDASGIELGAGKEYLVSSRLNGVMREHRIPAFDELLKQIETGRNPRLRTSIIDAMTTNETFWFRDQAHFRMLTDKVLPEHTTGRSSRVRIWSAACSSGQEPYNISMLIQDYLQRNPGRLSVEILATDISTQMLEEAKKGVYSGLSASRGLSPEQKRRYFIQKDDSQEVRPEIKQRVRFRELNLTKGYELLGRFDVIFCRNVLIYFSSSQKQDILNRMARTLNPGGYLFLGSTESLSAHSDQFEMVSELGGIGYRFKGRGS